MADRSVLCRPAVAADAPGIVALIRTSFNPEIIDATVYGCTGMPAFVQDQLQEHPHRARRRYYVAYREDSLAGAAEIIRDADSLFLNYIAVAASFRRSGVGRELLGEALRGTRQEEAAWLRLDVFTDNIAALEWYERLGLAVTSSSIWWRLPIPALSLHPAAHIEGLEAADAQHQRYGFSEFRVATGLATWNIGRLGHRWFRLAESGSFRDRDLLFCLRKLDQRRELLLILPESETLDAAASPARKLATSTRMTGGLDQVLRHLETECGRDRE